MKKAISLLLSLVIFVCSLSVGAFAIPDISSGEMENPFYSQNAEDTFYQPITANAETNEPEYYEYNKQKYYTENDALYKIIRDGLSDRKSTISFKYYSIGAILSFKSIIDSLFKGATENRLSATSTDGDYARWSVSKMSWKTSRIKDGSNYYYSIDLNVEYYSTDSEEQKVDSKINSIVNTVRQKSLSDYETIKYIHDYICSIATYDDDAVKNMDSEKYSNSFSAYGVLCNKKGVCQSYASAFYRICRELGYNVRFVSSDPNKGCHAWNLIQLDDKFYYVDLTWDDEIQDSPEILEKMNGDNIDGYYFFLVDYDKLRSEDSYLREHTLYTALYNNDYYNSNFASKTSSVPYDYDLADGISTWSVSLSSTSYTYNGAQRKPSVVITDKLGNKVNSYTLSYSSNIKCGRAKVKISGNGDYSSSTTYRTYNITPSKMTSLSLVSNSRKYDSVTIKWKKQDGGVSGYQIQKYVNGEWKTLKTLGNVDSYKITGLSASTVYKFRIRAYKIINNYKVYGSVSSTYTTLTIPKNASVSSLSTSSKAITVKWSKLSCSGYEIQYSLNSSMSGAKTVTASSSATSKAIKGLKKGRRYYIRIRAYKKYNDKKYYSSWSSKKSIIVK